MFILNICHVFCSTQFSSADEIALSEMWINGDSLEKISEAFRGMYSREMIEQELSKRSLPEPMPPRQKEMWRTLHLNKPCIMDNVDGTRIEDRDLKEIKKRIALSCRVPLEKVKHIKHFGHEIQFKILSHETDPDVFFFPFSFRVVNADTTALMGLSEDDLRKHPTIQSILLEFPIHSSFLIHDVDGHFKAIEVDHYQRTIRLNYIFLEGLVNQIEDILGVESGFGTAEKAILCNEDPEECPVCFVRKYLVKIKCGEGNKAYHAVCLKCITQMTNQDRYECPLCRFSHTAAEVQETLQNQHQNKVVIVKD